jgi:nucleoside diphosphate kinase
MRTFLKHLRSEAADSVTAFIITSLPFILFVTGWTIDYTKNASVKSDLNDIASEAVTSAVRMQTGDGSLQCGQDSKYEATYKSTPTLVARGLTEIQEMARGDYSHIEGVTGTLGNYKFKDGSTFTRARAETYMQLASAYLQKTGRSSSEKTYNDDTSAVGTGGVSTTVSSGNDARFVSQMRSYVSKAEYNSAENNSLEQDYGYSRGSDGLNGIDHGSDANDQHFFYDNVKVDATGDDMTIKDSLNPSDSGYRLNNNESLVLAVTCYRGLSNTGSNSSKTVGDGNKFTTISVDIRDWTSNFTMGMFNSDWDIQRFRINQRATTSWSNSVIK